MGDHFWPAVYPGIAVGLLYGFYLGGFRNLILGGTGSLAAAYLAFVVMPSFFGQEGIVPLGILLVLSLAGAAVLAWVARIMTPAVRQSRS